MNDAKSKLSLRIFVLMAAAICATAWMGGLEFQLDDYEQVYDAADLGRPATLLGEETDEKLSRRGQRVFAQFYRPTLHLSFALDFALFGPSATAFHLMSVAWHVLAVLVFYLTLLAILEGDAKHRVAFVAALIFAIHPGKWGAISWIAARGDLLMTVFGLLAAWQLARFRSQGGLWRLLLVFGGVALAILSKEGGFVVAGLLALLDVLHLRRLTQGMSWKRSLRLAAPIALCGIAYIAWRRIEYGEFATYYAQRHQSLTFDILIRMAKEAFPVFAQMMGGWFYYEDGSLIRSLIESYSSVLLGYLLLWSFLRPRKRGRALLLGFTLFAVTAIPILRFYPDARTFEASRLFYLPQTFSSLALAIPLSALFARRRLWRRIAFIALIPTLGLWGLAAVHHTRAQFGAARLIERVRHDLQAMAISDEKTGLAYALVDIPVQIDRAPTYGAYIWFGMSDTFLDEGITVQTVGGDGLLLKSGRLLAYPGPVRLLTWKTDPDGSLGSGRLIPWKTPAILPAPKGYRPRIAIESADPHVAWNPAVHPRDIHGVQLRFASAPQDTATATLQFKDQNGVQQPAIKLEIDPSQYGTSATYRLALGHRETWILSGPIVELSWTLSEGCPPLIALDFDGAPTTMDWASHPDRASLSKAEPTFTFQCSEEFPLFMIHLDVDGSPLSWLQRREDFQESEDGGLSFHVSQIRRHAEFARFQSPAVGWGPEGHAILDEQGLEALTLRLRVEAYRGQVAPELGGSPQAISPELKLLVVR